MAAALPRPLAEDPLRGFFASPSTGPGWTAGVVHYFGSRDGLFDAVFNEIGVGATGETLDPLDLAEYAGRLFDRYEQDAEIQRPATWYRLERSNAESPLDLILASNKHEVESIAKAQADGTIPAHYEPIVLLGLLLQLASLWAGMTPEYALLVSRTSAAERRKVITDAVAALLKD